MTTPNILGRLAQLVEHRPYKPQVTSSSLVPPTILKHFSMLNYFFIFLLCLKLLFYVNDVIKV